MPQTVSIEPPEVFIDSAGFIGLHVPTDAHHQEALVCRDQTLKFSRLYTSSAVIAETVAHIQRDNLLDQRNLNELINDFLKPEKWLSLLAVDDEALMTALKMVKEKQDTRFSLVDATNIVLMEKHRIDTIFTFDNYYDGVTVRRGYSARFLRRVPE